MLFSGKKIKTPQRGLLAMHPFVDVLEGRDLFTATAFDGLLAVTDVVDGPTPAQVHSPWSEELVAGDIGEALTEGATPVEALASQTTPGVYTLDQDTQASAFSQTSIGDNGWTLFGNALHDRRQAKFEPRPLPNDEEIEAARDLVQTEDAFSDGRSLTGAMRPFFVMHIDQVNHPFAASATPAFASDA